MKNILILFFIVIAITDKGFAQTSQDTLTQVLVTTKGDTIKSSKTDKIFHLVEIESEFPGGQQAWVTFLQSNLEYPDKAARKNIQGTVVLQFIVCTDGSVCNVEAISGPSILREAALKAIKNTPNWTPAVQSGKNVKSFKKQPITFRLTN